MTKHDFTWMTDEVNDSVIPAELYVALFRECFNLRLDPWSRPFSCFLDLVTNLCQNITVMDSSPA